MFDFLCIIDVLHSPVSIKMVNKNTSQIQDSETYYLFQICIMKIFHYTSLPGKPHLTI